MKKHQSYLFFLLLYATVLIGFYLNEDNLGKATHDALHHFNVSKMFAKDFFETLALYGSDKTGYGTRNSPVFWIFLSFLSKFINYDLIRLMNTLSLFLISLTFYKCLLFSLPFFLPPLNHLIYKSFFQFSVFLKSK